MMQTLRYTAMSIAPGTGASGRALGAPAEDISRAVLKGCAVLSSMKESECFFRLGRAKMQPSQSALAVPAPAPAAKSTTRCNKTPSRKEANVLPNTFVSASRREQ